MSEEFLTDRQSIDPTAAPIPVPLFDYVLLQAEKDVKLKSGIIMPGASNYAIVRAVGPGKYQGGAFVPTTVKIGDRVAMNMPEGVPQPVLRWGEKYVCIEECYLCAVLPGELPPETPRIDVPTVTLS